MPPQAQARAWWADVEDVKQRIERKRERERRIAAAGGGGPVRAASGAPVRSPAVRRRGVREVRPGKHLMVVRSGLPAPGSQQGASVADARSRRRPPRPLAHRLGGHPDRMAAWAVVLGFALVLAAVLSAHG